jgi:hypothetical protein
MAGGGVTSNHYHTLGVAPWAEDAVIRAAYVALMRTYHPDRNPDPQAEARVREITGAFGVLGDPQKRAAYDAGALRNETRIGEESYRPPRPPMRNLGIASVALAVVVSVAFAVWPKAEPVPGPQFHRAVVAAPEKPRVEVAALDLPAAPEVIAQPASVTPAVSQPADIKPVLPEAPVHAAVPAPPKIHTPVLPKREIARAVLPKAPPATPVEATRPPAPPPPAMADRKVQVERIATGFLRQSLEHADAHKQELLLSARNRAAALRASCRSDDCVTDVYLRQIRETTAIVEGRTPTP